MIGFSTPGLLRPPDPLHQVRERWTLARFHTNQQCQQSTLRSSELRSNEDRTRRNERIASTTRVLGR
jgi:hypothetical protein